MTRILRVPVTPLQAGYQRLPAEAAHYVTRVHRLQVGAAFVAFDPQSATLALATIRSIDRGRVDCEFARPEPAAAPGGASIHLLQALGKGDKPDRIVRDATALGAQSVRFVVTAHTVVQLGERADARLSRWKAIAIEAARQSLRPDLPALLAPVGLGSALGELPAGGLRLLLDVDAKRPLLDALPSRAPQHVVLLLGPEGGLSPDEREHAITCGFESCSLGPYVLRTETAAVAALGAVTQGLVMKPRSALV